MDTSEVRQEIEQLVSRGVAGSAEQLLAELWRTEKTASAASFLVRQYEQLRPRLKLLPHRLAILRSFTVEPMVPLLRAAAFIAKIDLTVQLSDFNAHVQEIIDPASRLYSFRPDAIILAVQARDLAPDLWGRFSHLRPEDVRSAVTRAVADFRGWINALRQNSRAHLIVHNLEQPSLPSAGILDSQTKAGQRAAIARINRELRAVCAEQTSAYVLDYDALVARHGQANWHDERKWLTVRMPIASQHLDNLVREWLKFVQPLTGRIAKALVVDLDNTLWGGVIGEDGMEGIKLGLEYPGAAFQELQRALLDLYARGILLAICSKNNQDDAMEALGKHPGMVLQPSHFAAMRINWGDKSQNLREIAAELNLGIDALAFLDDNPLERRQVRATLPEVFVLDLPSDPMDFARTVRECPVFERLALSTEDRQRGAMYQAQQERRQLEGNITSRVDFYWSLQQEAEIAPMTKSTLPRIAQLTNKTNQFNLTTHRYTEEQLFELAKSPDWHCFSVRVRDRFGDNGLVGVAITHDQAETCEIDTFLLSCRVIGRTIETAFLWFLAEHARARGAQRLQGWFLPTKKNAPARDFYSVHGLELQKENGNGSLWTLDLSARGPCCPDWIRLTVLDGDNG